ncbi:MAG: TonB-dependent receptor [Ignavibacteriae bacterium]|nr:TonB-dependent receptor [Ignavibacteriota bacterium]
MKSLIIFSMILFSATITFSQNTGKISGKILDENSEPVIGANVLVLGTNNGAVVGADGFYYIINLNSGKYKIRASSVGYTSRTIENVEVIAGLTTELNFKLTTSSVELEEVVVSQGRTGVQKDLTAKVQSIDASQIENLPVKGTIKSLITTQAGITADIQTIPINSQPVFGQFATIPNDGFHFRGGRTNETLYLFDGINVNDALWGGYNLDVIGEFTLQSIQTLTGTFVPQFGEAMSGVIQMNTFDNVAQDYKIRLTGYSDDLGKKSGSQNVYNGEISLMGPVPGLNNLSFFANYRNYTSDGYINGYIPPNWVDSRGADKTGDPEVVPLNYRDNEFLFGKLIWQISNDVKLRFGYYNSKTDYGVYDHFFKYNPYGTPHVNLDDNLFYTKFTHVLSNNTFYDLTISKYSRKFLSRVFEDPAFYEIRPELLIAEFSVAGENFVYFDSFFDKYEFQGSFSSQLTNQHYLNTGFSFSLLQTKLQRLNPNGWQILEDYDYKPRKFHFYVNDKMEFNDIGMVINLGLRYDYTDPNREFVVDINSPDGEIGKVPKSQYISPRVGVSYPISDKAAFRFGYGHYYQYPDFYKAFQGMNQTYPLYPQPNVSSVQGAIASGDIEEEKTVNYEVGLQLQVSEDISLDVTGFYRKTSNLIGIVITEGKIVSGDVIKTQKYPIFDNINFATVQGLELSLYKKLTNHFSGFLNYSYSEALVTSSLLFSKPQDLSRTFPADWDQTHTLSFGATFEFLDKWGFSILGGISSGLPYTYNVFQPNAERAPFISSLDAILSKEFDFWKLNAKLYVQISNLLNRKNVWWVYADSGKPGVDTNPATSDDYTNNPSMWGPGRRIQIGFNLNLF